MFRLGDGERILRAFVPERGLEPPRVTPPAPKAGASTISPLRLIVYTKRVRPVGIEPTTNRLRVECSTS